MAPLTQAEIKTILLKSTTTNARQYEYIYLLGLRKLSNRDSRRGLQGFEGVAGDFYNASKDVANVISGRYRSRADLHEKIKTQNNFEEQEVEDLIDKYGPQVWNNGDLGFVTKTDDQGEKDQSYPRHLIYSDESDRVKIRTYTYSLVLQCMFYRLKGRPTNDVAMQAGLPRATSHIPEIVRSSTTPPDPGIATINTISSASSGDKRSRDADHYRVAVAQMVPNTYTGGGSSTSVMLQYTAVDSASTMRRSVTDADEDGQVRETLYPDDPRIPTPPLDQVSSADSDYEEETGGYTIQNKRARYRQGETALTDFKSKQLDESGRRTTRLKRRDYSSPWVGSNRPPVTTVNTGEQEHTETAQERDDDDQTQINQRSMYRAQLALNLPCALDLQTQHTQVLEDTITLIADIRSLDTTLSKSPFDYRNTTYQLFLDQWLSLVAIYLTFRRATDFHDTLAAWNAHILSLPVAERWEKERPYLVARVSFREWRLRNQSSVVPTWSRDITWALLEMLDWPKRGLKTDDIQEMNRRVREFNAGLMAWWGGSPSS
ncbi:hypothetical protein COCMIDRAFT_101348 [Bipolaris oryzae ATCC 44560]|uniref:Uncharacterized protein n=1 Tax=Bipolaris oryzae ATCC 44560 TaxID=930090 RepID=W6Z0Q0_COCMI|nr:uncharacterized protein COCMIDRAFT_101348 [Bipolaris oryzae ATCC 44560]EUC43253.1 hypothetical protein COCMIDRAFT_101348 [Bipolaris oryzae ATCC 44560]